MLDEFVAETLQKASDPGLLLVGAKKNGDTNVMTIGWGFIGLMWRKNIFAVLVRPSRFTHEFLDDSSEFTVNVPSEGMAEIVARCGEVMVESITSSKNVSFTCAKERRSLFQ